MLVMSFNCRGLGHPSKKLALKRLVALHHLDVILLRKTLALGDVILVDLRTLLPAQDLFTLMLQVDLGGLLQDGLLDLIFVLLVGWFSQVWASYSFPEEFGQTFSLLNIHGPHIHQMSYWKKIFSFGFQSVERFILRGDLNFSMGEAETWGCNAHNDPLSN